jgi:hypothetical protein
MTATNPEPISREEELSFLFAQLIIQQSNMAMMLMGKVAHPESGKVVQDVEAARLFIDQLEMLEAKTKGNLSREEEALLKQTLMTLRLNFVEAVESATPRPAEKTTAPGTSPAQPHAPSEPSPAPTTPLAEEDEHRKKFSKKY